MEKKKNNLDDITSFVKRQFPEADAALLTGSFATKKEKKNSDIDLIIFSGSISQSFVEKIEIASQKYDVIYLSTHYNYLLKELYIDINSRFGVYANMISTSRILFDKNNILTSLIYFAKNILIKEYGRMDSVEIEFKRKLISNALEDIEDIDSFGEFYFSSSLIVEEMTNLILSTSKSTIGRGKNKARELKKIDPSFYDDLTGSIMSLDKQGFKNIIVKKLEFFGGVLNSYSPKNIPSISSESNAKYEILIKKKYFSSRLISTNYSKFIEFLSRNNISLLYFSFQNNHLLINIESAKIDNRLSRNVISWLASAFKIESKDKIIIKLSKSKLLPFVTKEINEILERDLVFFTKYIMSEKLFKNNLETLNFSFILVNRIIDDSFVNNKKHVYDYLYNSNILNDDCIDSLGFNYYQLIENRKKIIDELEIMSESLLPFCKREELIENYYSSLSFPKIMSQMDTNDLSVLIDSRFCDNDIDGAKLLILNFYLKYLLDIINSNNQLSVIANILKKQL